MPLCSAELSRCLKRLVEFDYITLTLVDFKERMVRVHILETDQPVTASSGPAVFFRDADLGWRSNPGTHITWPFEWAGELPF